MNCLQFPLGSFLKINVPWSKPGGFIAASMLARHVWCGNFTVTLGIHTGSKQRVTREWILKFTWDLNRHLNLQKSISGRYPESTTPCRSPPPPQQKRNTTEHDFTFITKYSWNYLYFYPKGHQRTEQSYTPTTQSAQLHFIDRDFMQWDFSVILDALLLFYNFYTLFIVWVCIWKRVFLDDAQANFVVWYYCTMTNKILSFSLSIM